MKTFNEWLNEAFDYKSDKFPYGIPPELKKLQGEIIQSRPNPYIVMVAFGERVKDIIDELNNYPEYTSFDIYVGGSFHEYWEYVVFWQDDRGENPVSKLQDYSTTVNRRMSKAYDMVRKTGL